jgi:hypothetical protein
VNGKLVAGFIVGVALIAGAAVWWLQVHAFYQPVAATSPAAVIRLQRLDGASAEAMLVTPDFEGIDATSSPLRFRACFVTPMTLGLLTETFRVYDRPTPLVAPGWFDCFDAGRIGADLETGQAIAFLSEENIAPGVDRVVAVYPDGRAFAWHQLNESAND